MNRKVHYVCKLTSAVDNPHADKRSADFWCRDTLPAGTVLALVEDHTAVCRWYRVDFVDACIGPHQYGTDDHTKTYNKRCATMTHAIMSASVEVPREQQIFDTRLALAKLLAPWGEVEADTILAYMFATRPEVREGFEALYAATSEWLEEQPED